MKPEAERIIALAEQVSTCALWRWDLDGMVFFMGDPTSTGPRIVNSGVADAGNARQEYRWLPLITHPTTKGWLLHMLREALGSDVAVMDQSEGTPDWRVVRWDVEAGTTDAVMGLPLAGPTEHDALVSALVYADRQHQDALRTEWAEWRNRQ